MIQSHKLQRLTISLSLAWFAPVLTAATLYVSPAGNDKWTGRLPAPNAALTDGPVATVARARDLIREMKRRGQGTEPHTVFLRGGVYRLTQPLLFTPEDSGAKGTPVTYCAYRDEKPVLSGGVRVTGWKRYDERLWVAPAPWAAQLDRPLAQLFVNGVRRPRARQPNAGEYSYTKRLTLTSDRYPQCLGVTFPADEVQPWTVPDDRVLCLFHNWINSFNYISRADWRRRRLTFSRPAGAYFLGPRIRYYLEGAREYLDSPGEWWLDTDAGRLYYYPHTGDRMTAAEVIAPVLTQTLVRIMGEPALGLSVEHLVFRGLSFQHSGADISPDHARSVQGAVNQKGALFAVGMRQTIIEDCEFTHLGEHAISLREGCAYNTIRRCHIHDMGGGGVYLSAEAPRRTDESYMTAHNVVDNNFIHDGGYIFRAGCGVFLGGSASHNRITHNEICDLSWMAVHAGWSWTGRAPAYTHHNEIAYNHLHHIGNGVLNDIGGIYTLGVSPGTVLHHNLIHHVTRFTRGREGYGGWGIYLDAGSSEIRVENNIVYDTQDGGLHLHNYGYPYGDVVVNNIFAYSSAAQCIRNANHEAKRNEVHLERNIITNASRALLGGNNWKDGSNFTADRNCYWSESGEPEFAGRTFAQWQAEGRDQHSIVADPLFIGPSARDFRLRPGSPAFKLGFQPIDISEVGLQGPPAWRAMPRDIQHRTVEVAHPDPVLAGDFADDFEDYELGETPDGGVPPEGPTSVVVTDHEPARGRQCLTFTDGATETVWKPHWFQRRQPGEGNVTFSCFFRLDPDQPASADLEFRDWDIGAGAGYRTGPLLRFAVDGSVMAGSRDGWKTLVRFPPGVWLRLEVRFTQGKGKPKRYSLQLGPLDGKARTWSDLPFRDPAFTSCTWVGFAGMADKPGMFYVDDVRVGS